MFRLQLVPPRARRVRQPDAALRAWPGECGVIIRTRYFPADKARDCTDLRIG
jgi:hypothetical protein